MILTVAGFLGQLCSILTGVFLVRLLTKESYGLFRQIFLVTDTFVYIFSICLPSSILYFFPKLNINKKKGFLIQTVLLLLILGFIGSTISFFLSPLIAQKFSNPEIKDILYFFSFYIMFQISIQFISPMLMGIDKYKQASFVQFLITLLRMILIVLSVYLGASIYTLMKIVLIFTIIQAVIIIIFAFGKFKGIKVEWDKTLVKKQFLYSLPLGTGAIVWFIGKEIDKYFLSIFFSTSDYAIYTVGALEIPIFRQFSTAISSVLIPKISKLYSDNKKQEIIDVWKEAIRKCMLIFIPSFGLLLLVSNDLITTLYTFEYLESSVIFKIYLLLILIRLFNPNIILQAIGKTKYIMFCSILFVIMNITLNYIFIEIFKWGITSPAVATVISYVVMLSLALYFALSNVKISFKQIFSTRDFTKISICTFTGFVVPYYLLPNIHNSFINGLLLGISFVAIFGTFGWFIKIFSKDDIDVILNQLKKLLNIFKK